MRTLLSIPLVGTAFVAVLALATLLFGLAAPAPQSPKPDAGSSVPEDPARVYASAPTPARPLSEKQELQAFLNCQLVPKLGNAWDYLFAPGKFPAIEWDRPEVVERVVGRFPIKVRWFDGEGREVTPLWQRARPAGCIRPRAQG